MVADKQAIDIRIHRAIKGVENPYFSMSNQSAQDKNLSWEARGMLAYLLSKPDDWSVQPKDLQQKGCGRDKAYSILKELEKAGYLVRCRVQDKKGKFQGWYYEVYERPFPEKPHTAKPDTAQPYTAKPHLTYDREEHNTEERKDSLRGSRPATPTLKIHAKTPQNTFTHDPSQDDPFWTVIRTDLEWRVKQKREKVMMFIDEHYLLMHKRIGKWHGAKLQREGDGYWLILLNGERVYIGKTRDDAISMLLHYVNKGA